MYCWPDTAYLKNLQMVNNKIHNVNNDKKII